MTVVARETAKAVSERYGAAIADVYDDIYGELDIASPEIDALRRFIPIDASARTVVELGVGTGRVLGSLGRSFAGQQDIRLIGIDGSAELLARAAETYKDVRLELVEADISGDTISDVVPPGSAGLVLCVCATISMLPDRAAQLATLRNIAEALSDDGVAIIETHSPAFILGTIGSEPMSTFVPHERHESGLLCFSSFEDGLWRMRQVWVDGDQATSVLEHSLLTTPTEMTELAASAGLEVVGLSAAMGGGIYNDGSSPLYALALRRLPREDGRGFAATR